LLCDTYLITALALGVRNKDHAAMKERDGRCISSEGSGRSGHNAYLDGERNRSSGRVQAWFVDRCRPTVTIRRQETSLCLMSGHPNLYIKLCT